MRIAATVAVLALAGLAARAGAGEPPSLAGSSWQLVRFVGGDDRVLTPAEQSSYTIAFRHGTVSMQIDCNRGSGSWKSDAPGRIEFGPMAVTRAMCASPALHDQILKTWPSLRSYVVKDGHLFLSLMADGGTYEFEPIGAPPASARQAPVPVKGPFSFACTQADAGAGTLAATFYDTAPALVLVERHGETRPAFQVPAASGSKYEGRDLVFWEAHAEATVDWGGLQLKCRRE